MVAPTKGPRKVGGPFDLDLSGAHSPFTQADQPVCMTPSNSVHRYLMLFSTAGLLNEFMALEGWDYDKVVSVQDVDEFLGSIPPTHKIAVDPHRTPEGKVRWTEVLL